jgi:hypothetical protein
MAMDGAGNILLTGVFDGAVDFGCGPLTSAGFEDIFLAKLDPQGNCLWLKVFGDQQSQFYPHMAVDGAGNILLTGVFSGAVDLGGGPLTNAAGGYGGFVAKLDPQGNHLWSKRFGGNSKGMAVDGAGNVILSGSFAATSDFGGGPPTSTGAGDAFVVKLDPQGNHIWSKQPIYANTNGTLVSGAAAVDGAGNILLTGTFNGAVDFGGGPLIADSNSDLFAAKLDPQGNHIWSKRFMLDLVDYGDIVGPTLAVGGAGGGVLAVAWHGTVDFGNGPFSSASGDIFLAKLRP